LPFIVAAARCRVLVRRRKGNGKLFETVERAMGFLLSCELVAAEELRVVFW
jgi:hypothetical protein